MKMDVCSRVIKISQTVEKVVPWEDPNEHEPCRLKYPLQAISILLVIGKLIIDFQHASKVSALISEIAEDAYNMQSLIEIFFPIVGEFQFVIF